MSGTAKRDFATLLSDAVRAGDGPQRILHLIGGIDQPDSVTSDATSDAQSDDATSQAHTRAARLVSLLLFEQDRALEEVQTGSLVRLVVETENGAVFCLPIQRGRHLVGVLAGDGSPDRVDAAGRVMIRLVDEVRASIGLTSQNPGGLARRRGGGPDRPSVGADAGEAAVVTVAAGVDGIGPHIGLLRDAVAPDSVHWVALVRGRDVPTVIDCFAAPELERFFVVMDEGARRRYYHDFAGTSGLLLNRVGRIVRSAIGGPLRRVVLDVEQGVIVLDRIGPQAHVMGVSLDQDRVEENERLLRQIASTLRSGASEAVGPIGPR